MLNVNALFNNLHAPAQLMLVVALVSVVFNSLVKFNLAAFVGTLVGVVIAVYNNNCLIKGDCKTWAWILAILYTVGVVAGNLYPNNRNKCL